MSVIKNRATGKEHKTSWKGIYYLQSRDQQRRLQSCFASSIGVFGQYHVVLSGSSLDTNLPWSELRAWFRFSDVPLRTREIVTDSAPPWECIGMTENEYWDDVFKY